MIIDDKSHLRADDEHLQPITRGGRRRHHGRGTHQTIRTAASSSSAQGGRCGRRIQNNTDAPPVRVGDDRLPRRPTREDLSAPRTSGQRRQCRPQHQGGSSAACQVRVAALLLVPTDRCGVNRFLGVYSFPDFWGVIGILVLATFSP
jgi:hypothetical protein